MKKVLVILGSTATGKTDIALSLAKKFNGELISCDSRQVYVGLDIGTGKLPGGKWKTENGKWKKEKGYWEMDGIKIWMYDVCDPKMQFTVKDYVEQANKVLEDIFKRGKLPIIVGGTGLYLKALLDGLSNLSVPIDEKLRGELEKLSLKELQAKLQLLSPTKWGNLNESDRKNPRRLLRSIELESMYGYVDTSSNKELISKKYEILKIGLLAPREVLKKRIFARLLFRFDNGLVEEAKKLHKNGLTFKRMKQLGLEYGMLADFLEEKVDQERFLQILGTKISQYAKRQMTWFKNPSTSSGLTKWFDINQKDWQQKLENQVQKWYY